MSAPRFPYDGGATSYDYASKELTMSFARPPLSIIFYGDNKPVLTIKPDGSIVSDATDTDAAAKAILDALDGNLREMMQRAHERGQRGEPL